MAPFKKLNTFEKQSKCQHTSAESFFGLFCFKNECADFTGW